MNRTERLCALVEELRVTAPRACSAGWLAERFEVSVCTIQRDVLAVHEAGVPILATPGTAATRSTPLAEATFAECCCPLSRNDLLAPNVP